MPTKKTNTIKLVLYSLSLFTGICAGAPVYAGDCNPAGPLGSYFCSGGLPIPPSGNPQQDLTGFPLQITTATTSDTFGIKVLHGGGQLQQ